MGNGLGMAKMRCMTERIDDETVSCLCLRVKPEPWAHIETSTRPGQDVDNLNKVPKRDLALLVSLVDKPYQSQLPAEMLCLPRLEECFHTGLTCWTSIATI